MKAIYLDAFAGVSGNMFLGALLDAGFPIEVLREELKKLDIGEYELTYKQVNKLGIDAKYFNVILPEEHGHSHGHEHEDGHCHEYAHEHEHGHENEHGHCHGHEHEHSHGHEHGHEHGGEYCHCHEHEHGHGHGHEHGHRHEQAYYHEHGEAHEHRNLHDIMGIINASALTDTVKLRAEQVFRAIAEAEGKVHGKPLEEVHFHEVGAIDTIIDIVGTLLGLEYLGIKKLYVGNITTGSGFVQCAHGLMPVPAPATAELLQGLPQQKGPVAKEMTTPTGAALVRVLAEPSEEFPKAFKVERIAYGAGSREVEIPNVLRMFVGDDSVKQDATIIEAACNIDDMPAEVFGYTLERLLTAGALDVWGEPIIMKKSRPAYKLCLLCEEDKREALFNIIFTETSTLGIRYHEVKRSTLERRSVRASLPEGEINVKCASFKGNMVNLAPEYEDCVKAAQSSGLPLKEIMRRAKKAAEESEAWNSPNI